MIGPELRQTPTTPCKLWEGRLHHGYGISHGGGRVHREEWVRHYGETDLWVLHLCINSRNCYEITHLYAGTPKQNAEDMVRDGRHHWANKTECPKGHPYDDKLANNGQRTCLKCRYEMSKKWAVDNEERTKELSLKHRKAWDRREYDRIRYKERGKR